MPETQELLKKFKDMKTLPHVAISLIKLMSDEKSTIEEFEQIIKMDPTLVLRLLRTVNSSYYGLQQKVHSISRAVVFIGMKNLRNIVVTTALRDVFKEGPHEDVFSVRKLWLHCAASSICCQMISERIFSKESEDPFLCGLLHDIGMIAEYQVERKLLLQTCRGYKPGAKPITEYETDTIGTNHCILGYLLAGEWKLPVEVQEGIKYHHNTQKTFSPSSTCGIIQIAEYFVTKMNFPPIPAMNAILSPELSAHFSDNFDEYKALIKDFPDEMSKAKNLYEPPNE